MLGYQTIYEKSMNGIKTVSDGQAIISNGNLTAININATNISGTLVSTNQPNITNVGTLTTLNVSGSSNIKSLNSDSIVQSNGSTLTQSGLGRINQSAVTFGNLNIMAGISLNPNSPIYFSGSGSVDQTGTTGTNILSTISMLNNANISQGGSGIITQNGSSTNALKATKVTGQLSLIGNIVQSSGSNTFFDSSFTNINQTGNSSLTQAIGGIGINALNSTTITSLTITNSLTIPSGITMPSATFNGDTSYIGTAKIDQSGSTGINNFNPSNFNGNVNIVGNLIMTGGSSNSTFKTPTILGITNLEGINQTAGTSSFRSITTNQIDVNLDFNITNSGTGIISQIGTGTNLLKTTNITGNLGISGNITQNSGTNTFLDSTVGNLTLSALKRLKFSNDTVRKITLYDSTGLNLYNYYGFAIEGGAIRYNTEGIGTSHVFSYGNTTAFVETMRVNNTGLGIGISPAYKLHILGTTKLDGVNLFTTSLNGITPTTFSYLDATSSIQTQINNINNTGNTNSGNINSLLLKTTNQSYSGGITTFSGTVNGITSTMVNLGNCDNTSDINKPISTLQQNGLNLKGNLSGVNNWTNSNTFTTDFFVSGTGTFPSTNTGGNQGLALYWNKSGAGGEVDYLSRGQGGFGGHRFYRSNNTTIPTILLDINNTGATFSNDVVVNGNFSCLGTVGNTNHTGTLTGVNEILSGTLNVSGLITGINEILSGTLGVNGATTLNQLSAVSCNISNDIIINGNISSAQQISSPAIITYNNTIISSSFTKNLTGLGCTIVTSSHYLKNLFIQIPLSFYCTKTGTTGNFGGSFSSVTVNVLRNGVIIATPSCGFTGFSPITGGVIFNAASVPASAEIFKTTAYFTLVCGDYSDISTYTCQFNFSYNSTSSTIGCYVNSPISTYSLVNCTIMVMTGISGYLTGQYTVPSVQVNGGRIGQIEVNDLSVSGNEIIGGNSNIVGNVNIGGNLLTASLNSLGVSNLSWLNFNGMPGAYIIDGNLSGISYPINSSITNYNDFYIKSTSTSIVPSVGSIVTATFNLNDKDDLYMIMPGYQLQVFDTIGYSGAFTLNVNNTSKYPIWCNPSFINTGSSCKLYYNGIELV